MIRLPIVTRLRLSACFLLILVSTMLFGQSSRSNDVDDIMRLMNNLAEHKATAEDLVDPKLGSQERKKELEYFSDSSYQLTLIRTGDIQIHPGGHAVAPVRVHFKSLTRELDASVEVKFIQRNGAWYFADFDFLGWPSSLVVLFIAGMIVSISLAAGVLVLRSRLRKQGKLKGTNWIKIFIPIFWPKLFAESRRSPD
jgi:hypothetical protein